MIYSHWGRAGVAAAPSAGDVLRSTAGHQPSGRHANCILRRVVGASGTWLGACDQSQVAHSFGPNALQMYKVCEQ